MFTCSRDRRAFASISRGYFKRLQFKFRGVRMKLRNGLLAMAGILVLAGTTRASTITVDLGASTQNFIQFGLGADIFGDGTYASSQGACSEVGANTQCVMSGSFTSATAGFPGGTYSFVTTYAGADTPDGGPLSPEFTSNGVSNLSHYSFIDPSTTMILTLTTVDGTFIEPLVTGGNFVPGTNFFFLDTNYVCTGTVIVINGGACDNYDVGVTAGAIGTSPVTDVASFAGTIPPPPPPPGMPEPSSLALLGTGAIALLGARKLFQA
jgi:hypothetical protein